MYHIYSSSMPPPQHHPLILASFKLLNARARDVVPHKCINHLVSTLDDGKLALYIGFYISSKLCNTLCDTWT